MAVNCGALTETLIEAELFGHERGAFTGAVRKRDGRFKAADGGTLFLDEVAELPLSAQAKLLRVLQEGTFEPLGTNTVVKVDVRVISATHRNLQGADRRGLVPRGPLLPDQRHRDPDCRRCASGPGDLPLLLQHFLQRFAPAGAPAAARSRRRPGRRCPSTRSPGNVRELATPSSTRWCCRAGARSTSSTCPRDIAPARAAPRDPRRAATRRPAAAQAALKEFEREYLLRAIAQASGKRIRAAEILGISRKSLWEKLRMHGISD